MKKIIYSLLSATLLFSACEDRLNIEQKGVIPFESFYQTDDDAQNALNNLYQSFCLTLLVTKVFTSLFLYSSMNPVTTC